MSTLPLFPPFVLLFSPFLSMSAGRASARCTEVNLQTLLVLLSFFDRFLVRSELRVCLCCFSSLRCHRRHRRLPRYLLHLHLRLRLHSLLRPRRTRVPHRYRLLQYERNRLSQSQQS